MASARHLFRLTLVTTLGTCLPQLPSDCGPDGFNCLDGPNECVPRSWRCDREADCGDGSDELDCPTECTDQEFACTDTDPPQCITLHWRCDGDVDCNDGSDERDCAATAETPSFQTTTETPSLQTTTETPPPARHYNDSSDTTAGVGGVSGGLPLVLLLSTAALLV